MQCSVRSSMAAKSLVLLGSLALAASLQAQRDRTALTGTVVDKGGGVIPGVLVRAVEKATDFARDTVTNREGSLCPGRVADRSLLGHLHSHGIRSGAF